MGQVSVKGEDLLLQLGSDLPARYHRLRASIPSKLWRWKDVAGWRWTGDVEHINALELRAVKTAIVWRLKELEEKERRFLHLVDSLVVLHALSRGRSSSRRLRRTLCRIGALQLAGGLVGIWGYVDTHQNPADRPSRRPLRKKWVRNHESDGRKKPTRAQEGSKQTRFSQRAYCSAAYKATIHRMSQPLLRLHGRGGTRPPKTTSSFRCVGQ